MDSKRNDQAVRVGLDYLELLMADLSPEHRRELELFAEAQARAAEAARHSAKENADIYRH